MYLSIGEVSCFFGQNSNRIINQDFTEIIYLDNRKSSYFSADKMAFLVNKKVFFFLFGFENRMSVFRRHTYLPCPIMSDFA